MRRRGGQRRSRGPRLSLLAVGALILATLVPAASVGAATTTFLRRWQDFDLVQLVLQPLFLFSATFFPVTVYPPALRVVSQGLRLEG